jgi:hypothetical protein
LDAPVQPSYEATLHYTEPLLRSVVFAFWRRTVGIAFPLILVTLLALVALGSVFYGMTWYLAVTAAVSLAGTLLIATIFVAHYRNTLGKFRKLASPEAKLVVSAEQFSVTSDLGSSSIAWRGVSELWCYPDFWLLMLSRAQFVTLPLAGISLPMRQFIREQVEQTGGKVR